MTSRTWGRESACFIDQCRILHAIEDCEWDDKRSVQPTASFQCSMGVPGRVMGVILPSLDISVCLSSKDGCSGVVLCAMAVGGKEGCVQSRAHSSFCSKSPSCIFIDRCVANGYMHQPPSWKIFLLNKCAGRQRTRETLLADGVGIPVRVET